MVLNRYVTDGGNEIWDGTKENPEEIATITLSDWDSLKKDGAYRFEIKYHGANAMVNGECVSAENPPKDNEPLERYDDHGRIYTYVLRETSIGKGDGSSSQHPDWDEIYEDGLTSTEGSGGYILRNNYKQDQGGKITFDKYLYLPGEVVDGTFEPFAFPAVTFGLWRSYDYGGAGAEYDDKPIEKLIISSKEVEEAFKKAKSNSELKEYANNGLIKIPVTFDKLAVYAPNGEGYKYVVKELKDELGGYNTWVYRADDFDKGQPMPLEISQVELAKNEGLSEENIKIEEYLAVNSNPPEIDDLRLNGTAR